MITLLVDEAYAFDFAAILNVKLNQTKNPVIKEQLDSCLNHIRSQLGNELTDTILGSDEYRRLVEANTITFQWVDKAKTDTCKASDVDKSNYNRCIARRALQDRFFKGKNISEIKTGYEIYDEKPIKIGILTCTTKNRKWLYDITNETKTGFVKNKTNVSYVFSDTFDKNINWGLYWLKPQFIREHIEDFDYILWMDDDAGFVRDFDISAFCKKLNSTGGSIFVTKDVNGINAGVFLLKNDQTSISLLDYQISCAPKPEFQAEPSGDNYALQTFCDEHKDVVKLLDGSVFNAYHKFTTPEGGPNMINERSVIVHIAGGDKLKQILGVKNIKKIFGVGK